MRIWGDLLYKSTNKDIYLVLETKKLVNEVNNVKNISCIHVVLRLEFKYVQFSLFFQGSCCWVWEDYCPATKWVTKIHVVHVLKYVHFLLSLSRERRGFGWMKRGRGVDCYPTLA